MKDINKMASLILCLGIIIGAVGVCTGCGGGKSREENQSDLSRLGCDIESVRLRIMQSTGDTENALRELAAAQLSYTRAVTLTEGTWAGRPDLAEKEIAQGFDHLAKARAALP